MDRIIDFFTRNKEQLVDFINGIWVNHEKTLVKFGSIKSEQLSLTFYIHGELDLGITKYEDKINCLFDCSNVEDVPTISYLIELINKKYSFEFSPFLKISKESEPILHAFHIIIYFGNDETR